MDTDTLASSEASAAARLLIHAEREVGALAWRAEALIQRMRAHVMGEPRLGHAGLALEIHDLLGHKVLALNSAAALVDVALPPGTYHVTALLGGASRRYTVALERGQLFNLYLGPAGSGP